MTPSRLSFSSPAAAAGAAAVAQWWDEYSSTCGAGGIDIGTDPAAEFSTTIEHLWVGSVGIGRGTGPIRHLLRHKNRVARDGNDRIGVVISRTPFGMCTRSAEADVVPGSAVLSDNSRPFVTQWAGGYHQGTVIHIPRRLAVGSVRMAEDLAARAVTLPAENQALRLLAFQARALLDDPTLSDPAVLAQAGQSLLDLVALAFGTDRDQAEVAHLRGARAARLAAVLRRLRLDYADPNLSPEAVARRVGISVRYLHRLLHESGASFSERIQELRLAKAFSVLQRPGGPAKVVDAAYGAGFNDLSHFNRAFRRRYGMTPTAARGDPAASNAVHRQLCLMDGARGSGARTPRSASTMSRKPVGASAGSR